MRTDVSQFMKHSGSSCHRINAQNVTNNKDDNYSCFWQVIVFTMYQSSTVKLFLSLFD